jgi:hypothetical protein
MKQDETIRSQKERRARGPKYDRLNVLIGKWINVGKTEPMGAFDECSSTQSGISQEPADAADAFEIQMHYLAKIERFHLLQIDALHIQNIAIRSTNVS